MNLWFGVFPTAESLGSQIVAAIFARFGKPDRTEIEIVSQKPSNYYYTDRHLLVGVDEDTGTIQQINIIAENYGDQNSPQFVTSYAQFIEQLKGLHARISGRISYCDFKDKLGSLVDAYAWIGEPPRGQKEAADFKTCASMAMDDYQEALEIWGRLINNSMVYK